MDEAQAVINMQEKIDSLTAEVEGLKLTSEIFSTENDMRKARISTLTSALDEKDKLLRRAMKIMSFHGARCGISVLTNLSGCEEHCVEYRTVIEVIKQALEGVK